MPLEATTRDFCHSRGRETDISTTSLTGKIALRDFLLLEPIFQDERPQINK